MAKIDAGLNMMSDDLGAQNWCTGEFFCLADVAVGCALGYLEFRFPEIDWRRAHPNLSELFDRMMQRPAFKETVPVG
jgi:glutathione S-transferase